MAICIYICFLPEIKVFYSILASVADETDEDAGEDKDRSAVHDTQEHRETAAARL